MAKATTKKAAAKPRKAAVKAPAKVNEVDAAIDAGKRDAGPNMQSGMDSGPPSDVRAQQVRDQFATADERGAPTEEKRAELESIRVGLQVRGY